MTTHRQTLDLPTIPTFADHIEIGDLIVVDETGEFRKVLSVGFNGDEIAIQFAIRSRLAATKAMYGDQRTAWIYVGRSITIDRRAV